jgi:murein L,D-transpeptidase YcbB/YkuD
LMKFQISQGLTASGTIDSQTLKILGIYNWYWNKMKNLKAYFK